MRQKHTLESVQQYFQDNNCELLETEYINNYTKMEYVCQCGEKSTINLANF